MRSRARKNPISFSADSLVVEIPDDEIIIEASFYNYFWVPEGPFIDRGDCFQHYTDVLSARPVFVGQASLAKFFSKYEDRFRRQPGFQAYKSRRRGKVFTARGEQITGDLCVYQINPMNDIMGADTFYVLTRKISALEAFAIGAAKENPRKGFPDQIEFPRLGTLTLPEDLEVCSIVFNFPQGQFVFNWEHDHFYYVDFAGGLKRQYAKFDEIIQKLEKKCLTYFGWNDCVFTPWKRRDTDRIGSKLERCEDSTLTLKRNESSSYRIKIVVGGRPLSPLETFVRGTESNPSLSRHQRRKSTIKKTQKNPRKGFPDQITLHGIGVIKLPEDLEVVSIIISVLGENYSVTYSSETGEFNSQVSRKLVNKRFFSLIDWIHEINSMIAESTESDNLFLTSFKQQKRKPSETHRVDDAGLFEGNDRIGRIIVIGRVLSPLEALVRGAEENPRRKIRR